MGTFGALAEFHQEAEEKVLHSDTEDLLCVTARGAIHVNLPESVTAVAYEMLSSNQHRWSHGIALCLPVGEALMSERRTVTELGPDNAAIRDENKQDILFDMGLSTTGTGCRQVDFCVRTSDSELITALRAAQGQSVFDPSCSVMPAILDAHPNRIALTRLGRVEVYQPIGGPATGGVSPAGPHTHVLPKLLASGRTHSANTPIPDGLIPCAWAYPTNPVATAMGEDKPFDEKVHLAFQQFLEAWGSPAYLATKKRVHEAIAARGHPSTFDALESRLERAAVRIALRQLAYQTTTSEALSHVEDWRSVFDRGAVPDDPMEAEHRT